MASSTALQSGTITLNAEDGASISAYHVLPGQPARAGLIVVQEIFGVNSHIRGVAERFAREGFEVLAPAFFDRIERGVELGYDAQAVAKARVYPQQLGFEQPLLDVKAAVAQLAPRGPVFIVGYCWGGSLAYLAAARVPGLNAAVGYYGGAIARFADEAPKVPVLLHFGEQDGGIPRSDVEAVRQKQPALEIELYPAGHGFNCEQRASYSEESAQRALARTLAFFARQL